MAKKRKPGNPRNRAGGRVTVAPATKAEREAEARRRARAAQRRFEAFAALTHDQRLALYVELGGDPKDLR